MVAASQMSLLRSFVPDERPKPKPVENPSLFGPGELQSAPRNDAKDSAQFPLPFRNLTPEEGVAAAAEWARILRTEFGRGAAKRITQAFAEAGQPVSVKTAQNWLDGGHLASPKNLVVAERLFGPGVVAEIYEPGSDAARAAKLARLKRLVDGGAA